MSRALGRDTEQNENKELKKNKKAKGKKKSDFKWAFSMLITSFIISVLLTYGSSATLEKVNYLTAFIILAVFISLGIIFDIVGLAVASCDERPFHSMSARKVGGASAAVWLVRNADRVSSFCNDVVGDIAGIVSGATGAAIASAIVADVGRGSITIPLAITGIVSSLTIFGKAMGKNVAIQYNEKIVFTVGRAAEFFKIKFK